MKLWALNVCVACILAGALDLFLPCTGSFKSIKTVLALYILVSVLSPAAGADWTALSRLSFEGGTAPADYSAYVEQAASDQLASLLEERLAEAQIEAQVSIHPGETGQLVTLYTDQPEQAQDIARELLGNDGYEFAAYTLDS